MHGFFVLCALLGVFAGTTGCTEPFEVHLTLETALPEETLARVSSVHFVYAGDETGEYALPVTPGQFRATERLVATVMPHTRTLTIEAAVFAADGASLARGDSGPLVLSPGRSTDATITLAAMRGADGGVGDGGPDLNEADLGGAVTHQGWTEIKALGPATPVPQSLLPAKGAYVELSWNAVAAAGPISSYSLFRSTVAGAEDYTSPLATGLMPSDIVTYTDGTVVAGTTYFYTIAAVIAGTSRPALGSPYSEVKVPVPPANMALVHRWIANAEMCGLLQQPPDAANDYRCPYTGPGGDGVFFDLPRSFFVDAYETGCNYTPAPGCGDATNGCLGNNAPPALVGKIGDVWYGRDYQQCYVKVGASTWATLNTSVATSARALAVSNSPGLPPLVVIDQPNAQVSCYSQMVGSNRKSLLSHREQLIAAAWSPGLDDPTIGAIENGQGLPTTGYCNANFADGLAFESGITPSNLETISGTAGSLARSVRTGGTSTVNCISRYGVRDLVGNVWEWSSDQLATCNATTHACVGGASQVDPTNTDLSAIRFDGTIGPGGGAGEPTKWDFAMQSYSATRFLVPLGLPIVTGASTQLGSTAIGPGPGNFDPVRFHGDTFRLFTDSPNGTPARGAVGGGSWGDQTTSGRFTLNFDQAPSFISDSVGLRCALPAE